jgi:hypothetical protein
MPTLVPCRRRRSHKLTPPRESRPYSTLRTSRPGGSSPERADGGPTQDLTNAFQPHSSAVLRAVSDVRCYRFCLVQIARPRLTSGDQVGVGLLFSRRRKITATHPPPPPESSNSSPTGSLTQLFAACPLDDHIIRAQL